jgi:hypothetical protein
VPDEGSGWTASVTADRRDEVGCVVWEFALQATGAVQGAATLDAWAERIAGRVTCLLEPLKVVEIDAPRGEALLRSGTPSQRGEDVFYYEVLLRGTTAAQVGRYRGSHQANQRREQIAFPMTHEALARLAADLAGEG